MFSGGTVMLAAFRLIELMARSYVCPRVYLTFAVFAVLAAYQPADGQETLRLPTLEIPQSGVAENIPKDVKLPGGAPNVDELSVPTVGQALVSKFKDSVPRTRGAQDIALFRNNATAVVLILTTNGLGSGSLLKDNTILTNRHVVGYERQVTVVFKPSDPSGKPKDDEVVRADVIKLDAQRDLALLRPASIPSRGSLDISTDDSIDVGADVAAIGHPTGKDWSFTKGIVSAFRPDYEWSYKGDDNKHRATVIQTQTPINPGNSGGPLLTEDGRIVGVNSFGTSGMEGLNFAVAAKEIRFFLANSDNGMEAAANKCTKAKTLFEGRNDKNTAFIRKISLKCDDRADIIIVAPDNKRDPFYALVDSKRRGKADGIVYDPSRSGKWATSFWDVNLDETFPLRGIHQAGQLMPRSFVPRCGERGTPLKDFKCA
jgi:S1-C subfamily serine protease